MLKEKMCSASEAEPTLSQESIREWDSIAGRISAVGSGAGGSASAADRPCPNRRRDKRYSSLLPSVRSTDLRRSGSGYAGQSDHRAAGGCRGKITRAASELGS